MIAAALSPAHQASAQRQQAADRRQVGYRILATPAGGDDFLFRGAFHQEAQTRSDRLFAALKKVLGGDAPTLNFVPDTGSASGDFHASATPSANRINLDPYFTQALIDDGQQFHNQGVNAMPHEMAHLRQTPDVYASDWQAEGGAQAFADTVSSVAAALAHIPYASAAGAYDGPYSDYVQRVQQQKGRDWTLGGQFGRAPVAWP